MKELVTRALVFFEAVSSELDRVLPRPVVPLVASIAIHLVFLPLVYVIILFEPEPADSKVFMLEGGLALGDGLYDDDWEEDEDEDEEDEWDLDDEDEEDEWDLDDEDEEDEDEDGTDRWGFPVVSDDDDKDDDWDSDWFKKKWSWEDDEEDDEEEDETEIIDDDLEEDDTELVDLDDFDIEIEEEEKDEEAIKEQIERFGTDVKKWDSLFADADEPQKPSVKEPGKVVKSAIDLEILAFIESNPYDDISSGNDEGPHDLASGVDFSDYDARLPELLDWVPADSLMAALISLDLLRARPDREELEKTFKSLGYFRQIAGGSDIEFFDDIDAVLIASNDPLDVEETFIILRHGLGEDRIRDAIDLQFKSLKLKSNWYEVDGRSVVQADKAHFEKLPWIYFMPRPGFVAVLHASKRDRLTTYMGSDSFGPGATSRLIGDLERHMRLGIVTPMIEAGIVDKYGNPAQLEPMPVAVVLGAVMFGDAFKEVVDESPFPAPASVFLMGRFGEEGEIGLEGNAVFEQDEHVDDFLGQWKKHVEPLRKNKLMKLIGAVDLIDLACWDREDDGRLTLDADVPPDEVVRLMALVRLLTAEPKDKLDDEHKKKAASLSLSKGSPKKGSTKPKKPK